MELNGVATPLEDLRRQALEHYEYVSNQAGFYNSFVTDAIRAYNPACQSETTFTESEVRKLIQTIWSEFVELDSSMQRPYFLRSIIEQEIENHPRTPVEIFANRRMPEAE